MSKLFHMEENDLAELEQILPELGEAMMPVLDNRLRIKLRRCQSILSNVRWKCGPFHTRPPDQESLMLDDIYQRAATATGKPEQVLRDTALAVFASMLHMALEDRSRPIFTVAAMGDHGLDVEVGIILRAQRPP